MPMPMPIHAMSMPCPRAPCVTVWQSWFELDATEHRKAPLRVARLVRGWAYAAPLTFVLKAVGVAAVVLPAGGGLRLDAATAVGDLGGTLAALALWRTWLLESGMML